jgi:hypothetical protein
VSRRRVINFNLEEVAARFQRRNPIGLGSSLESPKVAEYGNLGLWDEIPLGLGGALAPQSRLTNSAIAVHTERCRWTRFGSGLVARGSDLPFVLVKSLARRAGPGAVSGRFITYAMLVSGPNE